MRSWLRPCRRRTARDRSRLCAPSDCRGRLLRSPIRRYRRHPRRSLLDLRICHRENGRRSLHPATDILFTKAVAEVSGPDRRMIGAIVRGPDRPSRGASNDGCGKDRPVGVRNAIICLAVRCASTLAGEPLARMTTPQEQTSIVDSLPSPLQPQDSCVNLHWSTLLRRIPPVRGGVEQHGDTSWPRLASPGSFSFAPGRAVAASILKRFPGAICQMYLTNAVGVLYAPVANEQRGI
jgi:hypothetical protein